MGACASSLHKPSSMKLHLSSGCNRKPDDQLVIPTTTIVNGNVAVKPQWPPLHSTPNRCDFGSKEETFFDSQAWLESDCESDFMSVNGEFTPSRGNTPVHHNFSAGALPIKVVASPIGDHESCLTPRKKKRLSELFEEGLRENHDVDEKEDRPANEKKVAVNGGGVKPKREKWVEAVQVHSCLPSLLSSCRLVTTAQEAQVRRK